VRSGPTSELRERIKVLERAVRELRHPVRLLANEILRKVSAYFARPPPGGGRRHHRRCRGQQTSAGLGSTAGRSHDRVRPRVFGTITATSMGASRSAGCCSPPGPPGLRSPCRPIASTAPGGAIPASSRLMPSGTPSCAVKSNGSGKRASGPTACGKSGGSRVATGSRSPAARCSGVGARLMRATDLRGVVRGKAMRTTSGDEAVPCPLDRLNCDF
jgi:hypothetical protein